MTNAPLPPGLRPGGAAEDVSGRELRVYTPSAAKSQAQGFDWRAHLQGQGISIHPAADEFPELADAELDALAKDIKQHGLHVGIVLHTPDDPRPRKAPTNLSLIDGRSRLAAVARLGETPEDAAELIDYVLSADSNQVAWWPDPEGGSKPCGSARIFYGDAIDPVAFAISANIHRRHLTRETKRDLIEKLLKAQPEKSDRQIAATVKASPTTVGTVRAELEETGMVSKLDTRIGGDGVAQPAIKPPKPPSKEAQIRALREQKPVVVRPPAAAPPPTDDVAALQAL